MSSLYQDLVPISGIALALYCITIMGWCTYYWFSRRSTMRPLGEKSFHPITRMKPYLVSAFNYKKGVGTIEEENSEISCVVCLLGFEDGDDVKQLQRCNHSFHAPCIDMWLYSHSNCPVCRAPVHPLTSNN
ncbi:hypothetical protein L1049_003888 [Liquidambar formosana]|uniref:RING-type domain-containing protein n=1 Tax=Liquidambar formosana TaxID=63359 RepID=A0AAP0RR04_LIQFO